MTPVWVLCRTANRALLAIPPRLPARAGGRRIKASRVTWIKALQGDWRREHLSTLRQAGQTYAHYQQLISECDKRSKAAAAATEAFDLHAHVNRLFGTDLHRLDPHTGIGVNIALLLFSELVPNLSAFRVRRSWHHGST